MTSAESPARPGRTVRVRTEVAALTRNFDYTVPPGWAAGPVTVGSRVRVPLHGRTVRGWVVEEDVDAPAGVDVVPMKSWLGWGPPPAVVRLAEWAAWRWAGPVSFFLNAASPSTVVRGLPVRPGEPTPPGARTGLEPSADEPARSVLAAGLWAEADPGAPPVIRLPPATALIDLADAVVGDRDVASRPAADLVLVPSTGWPERLAARLRRRGHAATTSWDEARAGWPVVIGARAGAWAPLPALAAALVLDAHDPAYREESAPTYSAVDVVVERARRDAAACLLVSPVPPVTLPPVTVLSPPGTGERQGWAFLERVDRRGADPRTGLFSDEFVRLARTVLEQVDGRGSREKGTTVGTPNAPDEPAPFVCVYNRTGGASLLECATCGELERCARCGAAARRVTSRGCAAMPPLRRDSARRLYRVRRPAHQDVAPGSEPDPGGARRRYWGSPSARWRVRPGGASCHQARARPRPVRRSSSEPRPSFTGYGEQPRSRFSTSTSTSCPLVSPRPRRRCRCWSERRASLARAGPVPRGPGFRSRRVRRTIRSCWPQGEGIRPRSWPKSSRSAGWPRFRRSRPWRWCRGSRRRSTPKRCGRRSPRTVPSSSRRSVPSPSSCTRRTTARCATSWRGPPGPRAGGCAWRSTRRDSDVEAARADRTFSNQL